MSYSTIATIDRLLKMTGCRIVECKQLRTNDKKSNNPLPHNAEKSVALVYSKVITICYFCNNSSTLSGSPITEPLCLCVLQVDRSVPHQSVVLTASYLNTTIC